MERSRTISLIFILCHITIYKCSVSCTKSDKGLSPDSIKLNHSNEWNDKDSVDEVDAANKLRKTDFRNNSRELPGEYRVARKTSRSRQQFRVGDAHQVANYFHNGGLEKGHSHFFRDQNYDPTENNNMVGENKPINKDNTDPTMGKSGSNMDYNTIVKTPNVPASHTPEDPYMPMLNSLLGVPRNLLSPVLNTLTGQPQSSGDSLLGAPLQQTFRNQVNKFRDLPKTFLQAASSPFTNLLGIKPPKVKKRGKSKKLRKSNKKIRKKLSGKSKPSLNLSKSITDTFLREPLGYILRYILHDARNQPVSSVLDSPPEEPSDTVVQNSNTEQFIVSPAHNYNYIPLTECIRPTEVQQIIYYTV